MPLNDEQCLVCVRTFPPGELLEHEKNCPHENMIKCKYCYELFYTTEETRTHYKSHNPKTPYLCRICNEQFRRQSAFRFHVERCCETPTDEESLPEIPLEFETDKKSRIIPISERPNHFSCKFCLESFKTYDDLRIHQTTHPAGTPYLCVKCKMQFSRLSTLRIHRCLHVATEAGDQPKCEIPPTKKFKCQFCLLSFNVASNYDFHILEHGSPDTQYLCNNCKKTFSQELALIEHLENNDECVGHEIRAAFENHPLRTSNKNFKCKICLKSFQTHFELHEHNKTHFSEFIYLCDKCGEEFSLKSALKKHIENHAKEFSNDNARLKKNLFDIKKTKIYKTYVLSIREKGIILDGLKQNLCLACLVAFPSATDLEQHLQMDQLKDFKCIFCGKLFAFQKSLTDHIKIHKSPYYMSCEICHRTFTESDALFTHLRTHESGIDCLICGMQFFIKDDLFLHLSSHEDGQYECSTCKAKIEDSNEMETHLARHHEAEKCTVCDRKFNRTRDLEQHYHQVHMAITPFRCAKCKSMFPNLEQLSAHTKNHRAEFIISTFPRSIEIEDVTASLENY